MACIRRQAVEGRCGVVLCDAEGCEQRPVSLGLDPATNVKTPTPDCLLQLRLRAGGIADASTGPSIGQSGVDPSLGGEAEWVPKTIYKKQKIDREDDSFIIADLDVVSWIKRELMDGLEKAHCEEVWGPALWGFDEDGEPNFIVQRHPRNNRWEVVPKPGYVPGTNLKGLFGGE